MGCCSIFVLGPRWLAAAAALLLAVALAFPGDAAARSWSANGAGAEIVIGDCVDCGDDIGMMVMCRGAGPAQVTLHWAAVPEGEDGAVLPVVIDIDGVSFTREATTVDFSQIGFTPQFDLYPDDPLIDALLGGLRATVSFSGGTAEIGLRGSRRAFDAFKSNCPWEAAGEKMQDAFGAAWAFHLDERNRGTLVFGVPETDDTIVSAICAEGSGVASVEFFAGPEIAGAGIPVQVVVAAEAGPQSIAALANDQGRPVATVGAHDALWAAFAAPGPIAITVGGRSAGSVASLAGRADAEAFFLHCGLT